MLARIPGELTNLVKLGFFFVQSGVCVCICVYVGPKHSPLNLGTVSLTHACADFTALIRSIEVGTHAQPYQPTVPPCTARLFGYRRKYFGMSSPLCDFRGATRTPRIMVAHD
jgi:hypothetical protein